ncbi:VOC family protein [Novosphingopyxis sp.]|uniref:VOC family protein n=1 Tax=Novosphingopyxis sp. TaxID=2709690 RepID=UPI003B58DD83
MRKPKMVGVNHIALEVGDVEEALTFYGKIFDFKLRGRGSGRAIIDMGDQFIALMSGRSQTPDAQRHFGLVVDDLGALSELAREAGATILDHRFLDFLDPWGNRVQAVEYRDLQFAKTDMVISQMGLELDKSEKARRNMRAKNLV